MPKQRDVPIYVTIVRNADTYIRAGEVGAGVLTNLMGQSLEELATNIALYRAARAKAGYDPATGQVVVLMHTYIGEDLATARSLARQPTGRGWSSSVDVSRLLVRVDVR